MQSFRTLGLALILVIACLGLPVQVAVAAGGSGGGAGAPGGSGGGGPDLNKLFREGTQLLAAGECKKAERKFRKVLASVKKNAEANYLRGVALQCQDKHKSAARALKKATRYDKKLYAAFEKLGLSYLALGRHEDARSQLAHLESLKRACEGNCSSKLRKAHAKLLSAIGAAESEAKAGAETEDGAAEDQHGLLFEPVAEPQAAYLGAVQLINGERFEQAIEALRELTGAMGPHPDVLNYLGYAHRRLQLFDRAETYYEQALSIDPLHRGANEYLGEMWVELGRLDEARRRLAVLDQACPFGCPEYEDLERLIELRVVAAQ